MSKYSFICSPSCWRQFDIALPLLAFAVSLACLPEAAKSYIPEHALLVCWLGVAVAAVYWRLTRPPEPGYHWQLLQERRITIAPTACPEQCTQWRISEASRITWWGIFVVLTSIGNDHKRQLWVLKGEVSEQNYRRLCRQIIQKDA